MRSRLFCVCLVFILIGIMPAFAKTESALDTNTKSILISELLKDYPKWDHQSIRLSGEVIGQPIFSQNKVCIHLLDQEANAIAVWLEQQQLPLITWFGKYRVKGDTLSIVGSFNLLCPIHSGDTDIHAEQIKIIETGTLITGEKVNWYLLIIGCLLLLYPVILLINRFLKKQKLRKEFRL